MGQISNWKACNCITNRSPKENNQYFYRFVGAKMAAANKSGHT